MREFAIKGAAIVLKENEQLKAKVKELEDKPSPYLYVDDNGDYQAMTRNYMGRQILKLEAKVKEMEKLICGLASVVTKEGDVIHPSCYFDFDTEALGDK